MSAVDHVRDQLSSWGSWLRARPLVAAAVALVTASAIVAAAAMLLAPATASDDRDAAPDEPDVTLTLASCDTTDIVAHFGITRRSRC